MYVMKFLIVWKEEKNVKYIMKTNIFHTFIMLKKLLFQMKEPHIEWQKIIYWDIIYIGLIA